MPTPKLLPVQNQSLPTSTHFLCQLLNISECLPIEKQDRVNTAMVQQLSVQFCCDSSQ